jgi:hydrogenase nickel incorporation protein HypA/HybF
MHETSLAMSLAEILAEEIAKANATRATKVILEIGALSHVDPHAMRFAFDVAMLGGPGEGAELEILAPPGEAYCMDCSAVVEIARRGDACPTCGGSKLLVKSGDEMKLKALEVV